MRIVGIDLAGSEKRDSGYCFLQPFQSSVYILHSDRDILQKLMRDDPEIIAIDAPLSLPKGRKSIDERDSHHFRQCDLELRKIGIRFFPITLGPMRMLTKRGMALKEKIRRILPSARVLEAYPGATYDILGAGRKNKRSILRLFLKNRIRIVKKGLTQDELDGICCALTGALYAKGKAAGIGDPDEGLIIIPMVKNVR